MGSIITSSRFEKVAEPVGCSSSLVASREDGGGEEVPKGAAKQLLMMRLETSSEKRLWIVIFFQQCTTNCIGSKTLAFSDSNRGRMVNFIHTHKGLDILQLVNTQWWTTTSLTCSDANQSMSLVRKSIVFPCNELSNRMSFTLYFKG